MIIPACNEARALGRLLDGLAGSDFELIVVCNGCSDSTAETAGQYSGVKVLDLAEGNKARALNAGDRAASFFPRFYLDADIVVDAATLAQVARVLEGSQVEVAAPTIEVDASSASWPVQAFFKVWAELPYANLNMVGSGFYGLSEEGRKRFVEFPDLRSDDEFIRRLYPPEKRLRLPDCTFKVWSPQNLRSLALAKIRQYRASNELQTKLPQATDDRQLSDYVPFLKKLGSSPELWACLPVYAAVWLGVRCTAWFLTLTQGEGSSWFQDSSSRNM